MPTAYVDSLFIRLSAKRFVGKGMIPAMGMLLLILLICIGLAVMPPKKAHAREQSVFRLATSDQTFGGFNKNDTAAALLAWARSIVKEKGLNVRAEMSVFSQFEALHGAFLSGEIDAASLNVREILKLGGMPEMVYLPVMEEGLFVRYAVIVHARKGIRDPGQLVGKNLSIHESVRMVYALDWLAMLLTEATGAVSPSTADHPRGTLIKVENTSKAILQVFFGQADAALVTSQAFDLACELNPQLGRDLAVLAVSQPFVPSAFVFRPGYQGWIREQLEAAIMDLPQTVAGRQLLTTFKCSRMEKHPASVLDSTVAFINKHKRQLQGGLFKEVHP